MLKMSVSTPKNRKKYLFVCIHKKNGDIKYISSNKIINLKNWDCYGIG